MCVATVDVEAENREGSMILGIISFQGVPPVCTIGVFAACDLSRRDNVNFRIDAAVTMSSTEHKRRM